VQEYFVDLKDLTDEKISLGGAFQPGKIDFESETMLQVGPLTWAATAQRSGSEIRIAGSLQVPVELSCSRCLEPAGQEISWQFDLFFRQRDELTFEEDHEIELEERDTQTAFFTGTQLAIGDILREQVLLALPMKALCSVDCKGLCPTCGTNLNFNSCRCRGEQFSPHMEQLIEIKRRLEKRSS